MQLVSPGLHSQLSKITQLSEYLLVVLLCISQAYLVYLKMAKMLIGGGDVGCAM